MVLKGVKRVHNHKTGSNGLERVNWLYNHKIGSYGLEMSQLGTQ